MSQEVDETEVFEHNQKICWEFTGSAFRASGRTTNKIPAGYYEILLDAYDNTFFQRRIIGKPSFEFSNPISDEVIKEVNTFWDSVSLFKEFNIPHRRGILLEGPAGCGKSTIVSKVCNNLIENDGIIIQFPERYYMYEKGIKEFREIDPKRQIAVLMEDVDTISKANISQFTNLLDGNRTHTHGNVIYLATTNHLNTLPEVLVNRPSRFDLILHVGPPNLETRSAFFREFEKRHKQYAKDLPSPRDVAKDTEGFSFAHLKELFLSVVVFKRPYKEALRRFKAIAKKEKEKEQDN